MYNLKNGDGLIRKEIMSEEYADFLVEFSNIPEESRQYFDGEGDMYIGQNYSVIYSRLEKVKNRLDSGKFPYYSIPKLYSIDGRGFDERYSIIKEMKQAAGIEQLQNGLKLIGNGVIIGIIHIGIDYKDPLLRYSNGNTRIKYIWDQAGKNGNNPIEYPYGTQWTEQDINRSITEGTVLLENNDYVNANQLLHIACGRNSEAEPEARYIGAAPNSNIIMVRLKEAKEYLKKYYCIEEDKSVYQENDIMAAINYINSKTVELNMPSVILVAAYTSFGGHTGSLPLDRLMNGSGSNYGNCIICSTGANANKRKHHRGNVVGLEKEENANIEINIENIKELYMELWPNEGEIYNVAIETPMGEEIPQILWRDNYEKYMLALSNTEIVVENKVTGSAGNNRVTLIRLKGNITGLWTIKIYGINTIKGEYDIWLPNDQMIDKNTYFLVAQPEITLGDEATAKGVLSVGAVNMSGKNTLPESGRGFDRNGYIKPDIVAGVGMDMPVEAAAALTAGAAAQYMEWAFTEKNNITIRTDDIKNFFIAGALRNSGVVYPSTTLGYGMLNIYNSFMYIGT